MEVACDKAGRITLNEHVVGQAALGRDIVFRGGFTTCQITSVNPPAVDRDSARTLVILRALKELGI